MALFQKEKKLNRHGRRLEAYRERNQEKVERKEKIGMQITKQQNESRKALQARIDKVKARTAERKANAGPKKETKKEGKKRLALERKIAEKKKRNEKYKLKKSK